MSPTMLSGIQTLAYVLSLTSMCLAVRFFRHGKRIWGIVLLAIFLPATCVYFYLLHNR